MAKQPSLTLPARAFHALARMQKPRDVGVSSRGQRSVQIADRVVDPHEDALAKAVHLPIASQKDGAEELAGVRSSPLDCWTVPPLLPAGSLLPGVASLGRFLIGSAPAPGITAGAP